MEIRKRRELENCLNNAVVVSNKKRNLWDKYLAGKKFVLIENGDNLRIITQYRDGRTGLYLNLEILEKGLTGTLLPIKSARPIKTTLHNFSHKYNYPLGSIANSFDPI